jgi:DNA-binding HxlR family transcriptional regulator/putative sterol carrier protein
MARRSYEQYCPGARALDVVGERWTLLLVRELLLGPKRYTDLLDGLPGIAPNVLAERLRHLQQSGIARRTRLRPPAASTVYELTELGERLRPVVLEMARWGLQFLGAPQPGESFKPGWLMQVLEATADPDAARGVHESYEFHIDDAVFHVDVDDGRVQTREGPAADPVLIASTDLDSFLALGSQSLSAADAVASGRMTVEGDPEAGGRALAILASGLARLEGPGQDSAAGVATAAG